MFFLTESRRGGEGKFNRESYDGGSCRILFVKQREDIIFTLRRQIAEPMETIGKGIGEEGGRGGISRRE